MSYDAYSDEAVDEFIEAVRAKVKEAIAPTETVMPSLDNVLDEGYVHLRNRNGPKVGHCGSTRVHTVAHPECNEPYHGGGKCHCGAPICPACDRYGGWA